MRSWSRCTRPPSIPLDWHYLEGKPYLVRMDSGFGKPQNPRLGVDFAGTVEAVGRSVTRFKPGDEVFGGKFGAFAEYVAVREDRARCAETRQRDIRASRCRADRGITALQALRDKGQIHAGQKVLINGASGGVGTFAVQIAKSFGAEVTGVCSTRNVELVRSIGADHVIDYTREDFTRGTEHYDLIVDNVGTHSLLDYRRVLNPNGIYVMIGSTAPGNWFGWLVTPIEGMMLSTVREPEVRHDAGGYSTRTIWQPSPTLMQSGKVTPVIDRRYKLSETSKALRYLEAGHAKGKVVLSVE